MTPSPLKIRNVTTVPDLIHGSRMSYPPMLKALRGNSVEQVQAALDETPEAASEPFWDQNCELPLCAAVRLRCEPAIVQLLIQYGADKEVVDARYSTPLEVDDERSSSMLSWEMPLPSRLNTAKPPWLSSWVAESTPSWTAEGTPSGATMPPLAAALDMLLMRPPPFLAAAVDMPRETVADRACGEALDLAGTQVAEVKFTSPPSTPRNTATPCDFTSPPRMPRHTFAKPPSTPRNTTTLASIMTPAPLKIRNVTSVPDLNGSRVSYPPMLRALRSNSIEQVQAALDETPEAATELFWDHNLELPLCAAVRLQCEPGIIQLLVKYGADEEVVDVRGSTPLEVEDDLSSMCAWETPPPPCLDMPMLSQAFTSQQAPIVGDVPFDLIMTFTASRRRNRGGDRGGA